MSLETKKKYPHLFDITTSWWPTKIIVHDLRMTSKESYYFPSLSFAWNEAEEKQDNSHPEDLYSMANWTLFRLLHRKSIEAYNNNLESIIPSEINEEDFLSEFIRCIDESNLEQK